ncbi:MAG: DUF711 family protein [Anaerolineae bacterium]|nr:DUF711 family protein [Anaerolineae bacterium]
MRIRSVTIGTPMAYPIDRERMDRLAAFQRRARALFADAGIELQTVRIAATSLPQIIGDLGPRHAAQYARELEALCLEAGIDYCAVGTIPAAEGSADLRYIDAIPEILSETTVAFASVQVAQREAGIHLAAIWRAAEAIASVSTIEPSGFGNLRLAVLANCAAGSPFFPASYHEGAQPSFAVATESADLVVDSFARATTVTEACRNLVRAVEETGQRIEGLCRVLAAEHDVAFGGIDFSPAPYPETARSIGHAIEQLGIDAFGASGTLFATALITRALREARYTRCGFSGVMLPVLEDLTMARRSTEALYGLDSLLLYSAVCGTGLDTVPLPGDTSVAELASILLDVSTLAVVVDKPLTARLMPIPGKRAGDMTDFDFPYFANGHVLAVRGRGAGTLIAGSDHVRL